MHIEITRARLSRDEAADYTAVHWAVDAVETGVCQRCGRRVLFYGPLSVECPKCHAWREGYLAALPDAGAFHEESGAGSASRVRHATPAPRVRTRRAAPSEKARRPSRLTCRTS